MEDADDLRVVIPLDSMTKTADGRGRITLGSDYSGKRVEVAILEADEPDEGQQE